MGDGGETVLTQPAPAPDAAPDSPQSLVGQVVAGRYRVESLLGEGGMGSVYRAEHVQLQKSVALKVLHPEMTARPEAVRRFEREALASARIQHPHVVNATDFGKLEDGSFFLVLEYVSGKSLRQLLEQGALAPAHALGLSIQIAEALAAAHQAGIVHRDLKPENVMLLEPHEGVGFVKVLDFGIAKFSSGNSSDAITRHGTIFGTPEYMAPEQARGDKVDERADLYALGVILYELLCGVAPFRAPEFVTVLLKQINERPPALPRSVPRALSDYVMSLLAKEPQDRPATAVDVGRSLRALQATFPTLDGTTAPSSSVRTAFSTQPALARRLASQIRQTALLGVSSVLPAGEQVLGRAAALVTKGWRRLWHELAVDRRIRWLAFGAAALPVVVVLLVVSVRPEHAAPGVLPSLLAPVLPKDDRVEQAELGNVEALQALAALSPAERSRDMWRALGEGYRKRGETGQSFEVVSAALAADPTLQNEPSFAAIVRAAADDTKTRDAALELAARQLGANGVDILFDVWSSTTGKTPATRAAKKLLDEASVRASASRAATLALTLRETRGCDAIARLLPRVAEGGDERCLKPLQRMSAKSGCGLLQLADCYTCLRSGDELQNAIREVSKRPAPRFTSVKPEVSAASSGE
jgi:eukaryotic-like serine/threonine-protein kinase